MKRTKTNKGITLIALIITIVVLLILAAVAISSIQENGILGYATNAADSWNKAQANEETQLQNYLDYLDKHSQGGTGATGYQYSTNGTSWSATVASGETYTFENLFANGTSWTLYAKSVNSAGESTSTQLTVIKFEQFVDNGNDYTYYAKEGTTFADFIESTFAGQTHGYFISDDNFICHYRNVEEANTNDYICVGTRRC